MKLHHLINEYVIESTDEYYDDVHCRWFPVPRFWVGDFVRCHSRPIRSRQ